MNILPKISVPEYNLVIPSTKETVGFRPYLVKEEKILLIASESEDTTQISKALIDIVGECLINYHGDISNLTNCDIEYIFLQLRAKSVGESVDIIKICEDCEHHNEVSINLTNVKVMNNDEKDNQVKISDDLILELNYPTVGNSIDFNPDDSDTEVLIKSVATSLDTIFYGEETYRAADAPFKERIEFIEGLSTNQFQIAVDYLLNAPYVIYEDEYTCTKCGKKHKYSYTGLIDFFI